MKVTCPQCHQVFYAFSHEEMCDKIEFHIHQLECEKRVACQKQLHNPTYAMRMFNVIKNKGIVLFYECKRKITARFITNDVDAIRKRLKKHNKKGG
jgi:hypothetical protein